MIGRFLAVLTLSACVLSEVINKDEGARCSWKGASGVCVRIYQCESTQVFLKAKEHPPICTFNGKEPVICCTDCTTVDDVRNIVFNPQTELLALTGQPANDKCVKFIDKLDYDCKINTRAKYIRSFDPEANCYNFEVRTETIPGELPDPREPYLALLGYGEDQESAQWLCAGTIISEKFILTAAHCVSKEGLGPVKFVAVDINKRTDPPQMWQKYNVKRTITHPEFQPSSNYNDIALLETEKVITFTKEVLPACLHSDPNITDIYTEANILVWEKDGEDQGILRQISLQEFNGIQCSILYPAHDLLAKGFNPITQLCYGDHNAPEDPCQSDDGGPLIATSKLFNCAPSILGVFSIDRTCGTAGSSGLFTKVINFVPWIENIVWQTDQRRTGLTPIH